MKDTNINIRIAEQKDLPRIVEIINQAIAKKNLIAYTTLLTVNERIKWFLEHDSDKYPILVAECDDFLVGWTSISPYRSGRNGLKSTIEVSYFVDNNFQQMGVGSMLLKQIIKKTRELGYKTMIAVIFESNYLSLKLLSNSNFDKWGFMPDVAEIDGKKFSHGYYGLKL
ncbi:MAG: GNAT family N-acetyltransferase [Spirochaetes bacterium]|jgi:L-amino acid N-acyltransferase YncA|nr:GNAT family N-acetyltransferase [Spirochaetota bacterium]